MGISTAGLVMWANQKLARGMRAESDSRLAARYLLGFEPALGALHGESNATHTSTVHSETDSNLLR
jgi:hypothetical protein